MFVFGFSIGSQFYKTRYTFDYTKDGIFRLYPKHKKIHFITGWSVETNIRVLLEQKICFVI